MYIYCKKRGEGERVLVIRVFSSESWSLSESRKDAMRDFRVFAVALDPQTPTSQSSAYRTYSIRVYSGLGRVDLNLLRKLRALRRSEGRLYLRIF